VPDRPPEVLLVALDLEHRVLDLWQVLLLWELLKPQRLDRVLVDSVVVGLEPLRVVLEV
jgi:hypothetical protein